MKRILLIFAFLDFVLLPCVAQIRVVNGVNVSNEINNGFYINDHAAAIYLVESPTSEEINRLLKEDSLEIGSKSYRFATLLGADVDFVEAANWVRRGGLSYGRLLIVAKNAKYVSLKFK